MVKLNVWSNCYEFFNTCVWFLEEQKKISKCVVSIYRELVTSNVPLHTQIRHTLQQLLWLAFLHYCLASASPKVDCWELLLELSSTCLWSLSVFLSGALGSSRECLMVNVTCLACFDSKAFCSDKRHTGHVDCFLSHISMQERWNVWPHLGMIRNSSFSLYSAKHITHL